MTSPSLELQRALYDRLKADPALSEIIGGRVYDIVPEGAAFPYVSFGPFDELSDDAQCITGFEISIQLDVWSRSVGFPECRQVGDLVRRAVLGATIELPDNRLVSINHRQTMTMRDPDGLTSHGIINFVAFVEQSE
ncbi:DUF3168 domain-containing protein [Brucella lupini]|uniref:DUF3168 domain-containing protein n=1 Tax=Brucella lupini TaxID=255457 RepID=A0AB34DUA0_9HYPH|nr:DUF3168 domain-containing protein [Brucella lupini]KAB2706476.1 DUF3168 domain-containing protein [Brucella lupini]